MASGSNGDVVRNLKDQIFLASGVATSSMKNPGIYVESRWI